VPIRPELEVFVGHEGSTFTVVATGIPHALDRPFGPVELELTKTEDLSTDVIDGFSLLFRGPREQEFLQANYRLRHETIGEVDLFLVPVLDPRPPDDRVLYQAIVSRLKP
jgi:hypothetical protein